MAARSLAETADLHASERGSKRGGEARAPFIHAAALGELGLGQRRGRFIEIAAAALLPAVMPLPGADAAGKDVVFQSVDLFL